MNIKNEKGSTIILFALIITVIIGFVGLAVDFGYAVLKDLQLTNAIDAATLAAGQDLLEGTSVATLTAQEYLVKNGIDPSTVNITFADDNHSIRLESNVTVNNRFMRVLGINTTGIGASAKAIIDVANNAYGIRPFGVEDLGEGFNFGDTFTLKTGDPHDETYGPGNFGALALGGSGLSNLLNNIENGYNESIPADEDLYYDTEPGNMVSMIKPIEDQLAIDNEWILPIVKGFVDVNGKGVVQVLGFAKFEIDVISHKAGEIQIEGHFIEDVIPNKGGGGDGENFGLYSVKLVE